MKTQKRINQALKQTLKKQRRTIKGTSIRNCIVNTEGVDIVYSFFDTFLDGNKVQLELVSIKINTENSNVEVFRGQLDYESYFRISSKDVEELQIHIQTNPNNKQMHIVQLKIIGKDRENKKSKFFLFVCNYESILSNESFLMLQIMAHKPISQIHWHPLHQDIFVALTLQAFVIYQCDDSYNELHSVDLKALQIRERIVDFSFWGNSKTEEKYFLSALGEHGDTYILFICCEQIEQLSVNNRKMKSIICEIDDYPCIKVYQALECSKNLSWLGVKVLKVQYNSKQLYLILKTSYVYRDNERKQFLDINYLSSDELHNYNERNIVKLEDSQKGNLCEYELPFHQLWNSSLIYYCDGNINKLDLAKSFNLLTSPHNTQSKIYSPSELENELILKLGNYETKFILFENDGITLLRRTPNGEDYDFTRISAEMLELEIGERSIAVKIKRLIDAMDAEISKIDLSEESYLNIDQIAPLSESANDAQIEKFVNETQRYVKSNEQYIRNEKAAINSLFEDIKKSSQKMEVKFSKKHKLNTLLRRIEENGAKIQELLSNNSQERNQYDDKIDEINNMAEFVMGKKLELEQDVRQMVTADIEQHLKRAMQIEEMIAQAQRYLQEHV